MSVYRLPISIWLACQHCCTQDAHSTVTTCTVLPQDPARQCPNMDDGGAHEIPLLAE